MGQRTLVNTDKVIGTTRGKVDPRARPKDA